MNEQSHSAFGPCVLVFGAILIANLFQFASLVEQRVLLNTAKTNVSKATANVQSAQLKIESIANDLLDLSRRNSNAKKIVEEFQIQKIDNASSAAE